MHWPCLATTLVPRYTARRLSISTRVMGRTYGVNVLLIQGYKSYSQLLQDAITALNTLQSNFAIVDAIRKSGRSLNQNAIPEMVEWCRRIGYEV